MKGRLSLGKKVLVALFAVLALFSLIMGLCLPKLFNEAYAEETAAPDYSDDTLYPKYRYLDIGFKSYNLDTSDTPETLNESYFQVYGKIKESDEFDRTKVIDPSLLKVTIENGFLRTDEGNKVTITYLPDSPYSVSADYVIEGGSVRVAQMKSVSVKVADGWTQSGGYWRKAVKNADGETWYELSAFVAGMTQNTVLDNLVVTANYEKSSHVVEFTYDENNNINGTTTGEPVPTVNFPFTTATREVTVSFGEKAEEKGSLSVNFEEEKIVAIRLNDNWSQPATVRSSTSLSSLGLLDVGTILPVYNSGRVAENYRFDPVCTIDGTLAPTAEDIQKALTDSNYKYDKMLTVNYNGSNRENVKPIIVDIINIEYAGPSAISSDLGGDPVRQTAHAAFDYSGLTVTYRYGNGRVTIPLEDLNFENNIKVSYSTSGNDEYPLTELSTQVRWAKITVSFSYINNQGQTAECYVEDFREIEVDPAVLSVPALQSTDGEENYDIITYSVDNCFKTLDLTRLDSEALTVSFTDSQNNDAPIDISKPNDVLAYNSATGEINFKRSGVFVMSVALEDGGDYVWGNLSPLAEVSGRVKKTDYELQYTLQVNKAPIDVSLVYENGANRIYGWTEETSASVSAKIQGTQDPIEGMGMQEGAKLVYEFWYYKGTESAASATKDVTKIREVGNYFVLVRTLENDVYQAGQSSAVSFEISPKPISVTDIAVESKVFNGEAYDLDDFINYKSVPFAYEDKLADIFTVSGSGTERDNNNKVGYIHANQYTASIAFNQEKLGKNYRWTDGATGAKSISFEINAREITVTASANGFIYGETEKSGATATVDMSGYVTLSQPAYYLADGATPLSGATETWNAGSYRAYFTWGYDAGIVAKDGDIVLKQNNTALSLTDKRFYAEFTVGKATLTKIDFTTGKDLGTYDGSGHEIASNWGSVAAGLKNGNALADILAVRIDGTLFADISDKTITTGMRFENGSVFVTEAGTYRITVSFKETNGNYQWAEGRSDAVFEDFTVAQKEISFQAFDGETEFKDLNNIFYVYNDMAHAPTVKAVSGVTVGSDIIELSLEGYTALYGKDGTELSSAPVAAGEYYVLVKGFASEQIGEASYTYAVNFKLPENCKIAFKINSSALKIPSLKAGGTSVEAEYQGAAYDFLDYLNGDRDYFNSLKITIKQGNTVEVLKNVYLVDGKAAAYTVTVAPATNYKWEGATAEADETKVYEFTFTITQRAITDIVWGEDRIYTGSVITFTATANGLCEGDTVKLSVTFENNPINAGEYLGIADIAEEGAYWQNYSVNATHKFTVKKFGLQTPSARISGQLKYTGKMQSVSYGELPNAAGNSDWGLVTVSATHKQPESYNATAAAAPFITKASFNGTFSFTDAGTYSVTFELTEEAQKNYYFGSYENQATYVTLADFTVERLEIELPWFGSHAYQWDGSVQKPSFIPSNLQTSIGNTRFSVNFAVAHGIWALAGNSASADFTARGFYYARLTMTGATADGQATELYNLIWTELESEKNAIESSTAISGLKYGAPTQDGGGVAYDLMYAIINRVLNFTFEIKGYTFGGNGMGGTALDIWNEASFIRVVTDGAEDIQSIFESEAAASRAPEIKYTFTDEKGTTLTAADLSNGLPWNAGKYSVTIEVNFGAGSDFENLSFTDSNLRFADNPEEKKLVVSPQTIADGDIEFTDKTVTYNGQSHNVAVNFKEGFLPQKADGAAVNLTIASEEQTNANANPYRLALTLGGTDKDNFALATNITLPQLTINPCEVTIHGITNGHDSAIYGDEIPLSSFEWAYVNEDGTRFLDSDVAGLNLTVTLEGYIAGKYLAVKDGGYRIGVDYTANGNYVITVNPETFTVTPRPITVTVNKNAGSTYGGAVDLYGNGVITVDNKAADDDIHSIVKLTAKLDGIDASETAKVGTYAMGCVLSGENSGNYTLTFNGGNYVISNAKFSIGAIADKTETYNAQGYSVLAAAPSTVNGVRLSDNNLTFWVANKQGDEAAAPAVGDARWESFNTVKARNVADSGVYWVLATADNHDAATTSFTFTVNPKEISVSLNFAIWYGEENPAGQTGYRREISDLTFTLCAGDARSVVGGSFSYTVPTYQKGDGKGDYGIELTLSLTAANYTFTAGTGKLTVKPLEITVDIASVSSVYGAERNALTAEITTPKSSYSTDEAVYVALIDGEADIFTLSTVANTDGYKNVGTYPITGAANGSKADNYDVTFTGENGTDGVYSITPATITVSFEGTDVYYNETEQKLLNKYHAKGVDGTAEITYYLAKDAASASEITTDEAWDNLTQGVISSEVPSSIDVWNGYVYYRVSLANHATVYGSVETKIKQATNNDAQGFAYGTDNQWIYGYGGADGFDQGSVTNPTVTFTRGTNANRKTDIRVAVYRGSSETAIASNIYVNGAIDAKGLLESLFAAGSSARFTAGTYRLVVSMEETDNFTAFSKEFKFTVAPRALSVKAENQTVSYGDDAKPFTAVAVGLVSNVKDAAAETLAAVFGEEPVFTTDYQTGKYTGEYFINISAENQAKYIAAAGNYQVTFPQNEAKITVEKRSVTVEIADKSNYYNLNKGAEAAATLTFKVTAGTFYLGDAASATEYTNGNQPVITLRTEALSNKSSDIRTNDVKLEGGVNVGYSIYAVWGARSERSYGEDYVITITNASKTETADGAIRNEDGSANAATFKIQPALMTISPDKTPVGKYNGLPQEYTMKVASDATVEIVSTYVGRDGTVYGSTNVAPTNVGKYTVTFSASNPNYQASGDVSVNFNIDPAEVTIVPIRLGSENDTNQTAWVKYGTQISNTGAAIDGYFSGFGLKYTFVLGADATLTKAEEIIAFETDNGNWTKGNITYGIANYAPNKNAGQNVNVFYTSGIVSPNFTQTTTVPGELHIEKRDITVWVKGFDADGNLLGGDLANDGATGEYSGESQQQALNQKVQTNLDGFFKPSDNWAGASGLTLKDLGLALTVTDARVVGTYLMRASASSNNAETNFVIKFEQNAYYKITPAPLNVYVQVSDTEKGTSGSFAYDTTNRVYTANGFGVIYGNTASFAIAYDGFRNETIQDIRNREEIANADGYTLNYKAGSYAIYNVNEIWGNNRGTYLVSYAGAAENALAFTNYTITYVPTQFEVARRAVTAKASSQIYTEGNGYNEGASGARLDAVIVFANADVLGVSALTQDTNYLPKLNETYALTYAGKRVDGQTTNVPNVAGEFAVTIAFNDNSNYTFVGGSSFVLQDDDKYVIEQQEINLAWNNSAMPEFDKLDDAQKIRKIENYVRDIMDFGTDFEYMYRNVESGEYQTEKVPQSAYTYEDGFTFKAYGAGSYRMVIRLKASAQNNYTLRNAVDGAVTLLLTVTTESVTLRITGMTGWIYKGYNASVNTPAATVDGVAQPLPFTYARIALDYGDEKLTALKGRSFNESEFAAASTVLGITEGSFSANVPTEAGTYAVCAYYQPTGQRAYYLFEVKPMAVSVPEFLSADTEYTGNQLSLTVNGVEGVTVTAGNCYVTVNGENILIQTINSGTYKITFSLSSSNYVWKDDSREPVVKDWVIAQGQDEITGLVVTGDGANASVVYGGLLNAYATSAFNGQVYYAYREKVEGKTPEEVTDGWGTRPVNAKTYWVRATTEGTGNYLGATAYTEFTIYKATLTVTPYAAITYGDAFNAGGGAGYGYEVSGFLRGDGRDVIRGSVTYSVPADADWSVTEEGVILTVNVSGLSADNYEFVAAAGKLTVGKKSITVTIGNAEAFYTVAISVSGVRMTAAGNALVSGDTLEGLNLQLKVVDLQNSPVTAGAPVGSYAIVSDVRETQNYVINYNTGIFTVKALPVSVSLRANGGVYDGTAKGAEVISVISSVQGYDADKVRTELTDVLTFSYTGITMGGTAYNSDAAPVDAGSYMASVVGVSTNFTLLTTPSVSFTIRKKVIAESEISIPSQIYDGGRNLIPAISDTDDYTVTVGQYTVAGTHGVMLTLKDANNAQWQGTTQNFCIVDFVVTPADNIATLPLSIEGWTYGSAASAPSFAAKYESAYTFRYYDADGKLLSGVPANAGSYSVTVSAAGTADWNALPESEPVSFTIAKLGLNAPKLVIVSEGEGKNDTFTGSDLRVQVTGYDHLLMSINYAGNSVVHGNEVTLIALNAGTYGVTFSLADADNYAWNAASGVTVEAGSATVGWTVNRMKVNKPKPGNNKLIVNGSVLTYLPEGFDPDIMYIKDNEVGYGGAFTATVGLINPDNYEWADTGNTVDEYYEFRIVGANTVFIAVICSVSGVALVAAGAVCAQVIMHKRKKRLAEESMDEMDRASGDGSNSGSAAESASQGGNE